MAEVSIPVSPELFSTFPCTLHDFPSYGASPYHPERHYILENDRNAPGNHSSSPSRPSPITSIEGRVIGGRFSSPTSGIASKRARASRSWIWDWGTKAEREGKAYWVCNKCKVPDLYLFAMFAMKICIELSVIPPILYVPNHRVVILTCTIHLSNIYLIYINDY